MKQKHEELIKAWADGAGIEYYSTKERKWVLHNPVWETELDYRIKGDISIEAWDKHKEVIMAQWEGKDVQFFNSSDTFQTITSTVGNTRWIADKKYRISPEETLYCKFKKLNDDEIYISNYIGVNSERYKEFKEDDFIEMEHVPFRDIK